ncbi:MAG TPA: DNA-directed RNA polymerase subunit alpha C-terminal domain-containing protein [Longilinea sp.]|nr:DNA-directed RNA polymerase subunit alpha C-terminal domain-containing protein [Longilinea sp.]
MDQKKARDTERVSPSRPVSELNLGARPTDALVKVGLTTIGQVIERLAGGDEKLLEVEGFGRKSLIDTKKRIRQLGYELPTSEEASA